jgi:hypothetical protein
MTPPGIFGKKKKETEEKKEEPTLLEDLCKGDQELHKTLSNTLLVNPEMVKHGGEIDARVERAQEYEKNKDYTRARTEYQVAAQLALYEGKTAQVQKFFKKTAEIDPNHPYRIVFEYFTKKENAEKAVAVAQEYYTRRKTK